MAETRLRDDRTCRVCKEGVAGEVFATRTSVLHGCDYCGALYLDFTLLQVPELAAEKYGGRAARLPRP